MSPRPRTVSDAEILEAIGRAISRVGPAGLTLAEVAAEAGIAAPTLLQRFGSKRGMLLAFAAQGAGGVREAFASARAAVDSPLEALVGALSALAGPVREREAMANHLAFLQMDLSDPEFNRHARDHAHALRGEVEALLEEAARVGELVPLEETGRLARAVQEMFNGTLVTWVIESESSLEAELASAMELLLRPRVRPAI